LLSAALAAAYATVDSYSGRLRCPFVASSSGLYLYFPARTQQQPKLRAFIDMALGLPDGG
jgi:DNA-binding transcriptional LysR family regulator